MREQVRSSFAAPRQTVAKECTWSCWRTAGTPGRHRLLRRSWSEETLVPGLIFSQSSGLQATCGTSCRFLLNTQLMFLKKEKDLTSKQFDDDKWIRSLTEAQEVTSDVPDESVTYDQQDVLTPRKFGPFRWESSCGNTSRGGFWRSVREKLQP